MRVAAHGVRPMAAYNHVGHDRPATVPRAGSVASRDLGASAAAPRGGTVVGMDQAVGCGLACGPVPGTGLGATPHLPGDADPTPVRCPSRWPPARPMAFIYGSLFLIIQVSLQGVEFRVLIVVEEKRLASLLSLWHGMLESVRSRPPDGSAENLKSTTFFGDAPPDRRHPGDGGVVSRAEPSRTICEHLGWFTPKGGYRVQSCLGMLEQLEALGILSLPETRVSMQRGSRKKPVWTHRSDPVPTIGDDLKRLTPLVRRW